MLENKNASLRNANIQINSDHILLPTASYECPMLHVLGKFLLARQPVDRRTSARDGFCFGSKLPENCNRELEVSTDMTPLPTEKSNNQNQNKDSATSKWKVADSSAQTCTSSAVACPNGKQIQRLCKFC